MAQGNMFRKQRSVSRAANPMGGSPSLEALRGRNRLSNEGAVQAFNRFTPGQQPTPGSMRQNLPYSPAQSQAVRRQYAGNNPIAPAAAEAWANAAFMRGNPGFGTSSLDATQRFNGMTANNAFQSSMVNGYVGQAQISSPFDEQASRARAQERVQRGVLPAERGGSYGRWAGGGGLADYAASGGVPWQERAMNDRTEARRAQDYATSQAAMAERMATQMPTDRAQNVFVKPSRDGQGLAYTDRLTALRNMPADTPGLADAISLEEGKRQASKERMAKRLEDYKAANGGMNAQAVARQRRQDRPEQGRYQKAIRQGLNPMSPQAQALFPGQTQSFMQQRQANRGGAAVQNPMAAAFKPDAPNTPENRAARASVRSTIVNGDPATGAAPSPTLSAFGVTTDATPDQFRWALVNGLESGDVSPEGVQDIFNFVKTYDAGDDGGNPFAFAPGLDTLWAMPPDAKKEDLDKWYQEYKAAVSSTPKWSPEGGYESPSPPKAPPSISGGFGNPMWGASRAAAGARR